MNEWPFGTNQFTRVMFTCILLRANQFYTCDVYMHSLESSYPCWRRRYTFIEPVVTRLTPWHPQAKTPGPESLCLWMPGIFADGNGAKNMTAGLNEDVLSKPLRV